MKRRRAVALSFEETKDAAPRVQASGEDNYAREMLRIAQRYGVPLHQERQLVERLRPLAPDEVIPEELYDRVAEVLLQSGFQPRATGE